MCKKIISFCFGILFLIGISSLVYPVFSGWVNSRNSSRVVTGYNDTVSNLKEIDYNNFIEEAQEHNRQIEQRGSLRSAFIMENEDKLKTYNKVLNVYGNGVMGAIRIPKIDVSLPIYHTTEDSVIQEAVGHYVGSSFPIGGEGTHSILSGHRGLPSARLFTDLDQMKNGDKFYIDIMGETHAYEVDNIQIVLPNVLDSLDVVPGKDYVTLITCTPYGVNTHRMLVRGTRIPYVPEAEQETDISMKTESRRRIPFIIVFAVIVFGTSIIAGNICGKHKRKKSEKRRTK